MSSEEEQSTFATKGQLKILIERIRHIENQQTKVESEFSNVLNNQEKFASEISSALNNVKEITSEFNSFKYDLNNLAKMNEEILTLKAQLEDLNNLRTEILNLRQSIQKEKELQNTVLNQLKSLQDKFTKLEESFTETDFDNQKEVIDKTLGEMQLRFNGISNRFENIEKHVGITSGELMESSFDSGGMLREFVGDLLGVDQIELFVPENITQNPISAVKAIKKIIMKLSGMDDSRISDVSEILLRYADRMEGSGVSGRKELFVGFNTDVRRICEIGQSVLMETGQKRNFSRRICQEAKNLAGKWTSEEIIKSEIGVTAVLELFDALEQEFSTE